MKRRWVIMLAMLLWGCGSGGSDHPNRVPPQGLFSDQQALQGGAELFSRHCAFCHGHLEEGRSLRANDYEPPPMDFSDGRYRDSAPAYLYWRIEQGKNVEPFRSRGSVMPSWGAHFTEAQIWHLVAYLKSRAR
ncbi:MAG: hypothetical protein C0624_02030 [Desulfuromonas sp.]|nr:MAG: hypothetical protein C0624_02030 [Desulfuromonas sp.]